MKILEKKDGENGIQSNTKLNYKIKIKSTNYKSRKQGKLIPGYYS